MKFLFFQTRGSGSMSGATCQHWNGLPPGKVMGERAKEAQREGEEGVQKQR